MRRERSTSYSAREWRSFPHPGKLPAISVSGCYMVPALAGLHKFEGTEDGKQLTPTYAEVVPK